MREPCSECDGYETVIVDGEEVHCTTCSLRAEVERLRANLAAERAEVKRLIAAFGERVMELHALLDKLTIRSNTLTADLAAERAKVERLRAIVKEQHDSLVRLSKDAAINHALRTERITEGGPT